jgi:hypothetical protein
MDSAEKLQFLQMMYAAVMAEAVGDDTQTGVSADSAARKAGRRRTAILALNKALGVNQPEDVFLTLSEAFGCAAWQINPTARGFVAETKTCTLAALAKRLGAPLPCSRICLEPMEAMVLAVAPRADYVCTGTLFTGDACRVAVKKQETFETP